MPAHQQGQIYKLGPKNHGVRYYNAEGKRVRKSGFQSASAARQWFRNIVEPELRGEPAPLPDLTLQELVDLYLERHARSVRPRTIKTLKDRLAYATATFGDVPLSDFERMTDEIAGWQATLPNRSAHGIIQALRQVLGAGVRWGRMNRNPATAVGRNPQPPPRAIRAFSAEEIQALSEELSKRYQPLPAFAAATGLRPEEWQALERRDIDRRAGILSVRRTVSSGEVTELAKTARSRREVPLTQAALAALDALPPRLDIPRIFSAPQGGLLNLDNFRRREWKVAVEASGVRRPARLYDLRSTFASDALAAGVSAFELARVMGTSIEMIERKYGVLLDGAAGSIAARLDAFKGQRHEEAMGE